MTPKLKENLRTYVHDCLDGTRSTRLEVAILKELKDDVIVELNREQYIVRIGLDMDNSRYLQHPQRIPDLERVVVDPYQEQWRESLYKGARITVTAQQYGGYTADRPALPGSPTVGSGMTVAEAVGDLVIKAHEEFGVEIDER